MLAIAQHRACRIVIGEMMSEREAHADGGGKFGAVAARTEQPDRRQRHIGRHRAHVAERMAFRKAAALQQQQFLEAFEKIVARRAHPAGRATRRR